MLQSTNSLEVAIHKPTVIQSFARRSPADGCQPRQGFFSFTLMRMQKSGVSVGRILIGADTGISVGYNHDCRVMHGSGPVHARIASWIYNSSPPCVIMNCGEWVNGCLFQAILVEWAGKDVICVSKLKLTFDQIALSKHEQQTLEQSAKSEVLAMDCVRLKELGLVDDVLEHEPGRMPIPTGFMEINQNGLAYLAYTKAVQKRVRKEHAHNWLVAIFTALTGALLSEPLWALIELIYASLSGQPG